MFGWVEQAFQNKMLSKTQPWIFEMNVNINIVALFLVCGAVGRVTVPGTKCSQFEPHPWQNFRIYFYVGRSHRIDTNEEIKTGRKSSY